MCVGEESRRSRMTEGGIEVRPRCGVSRNQGGLPLAKARNLQVN